MWNRRRVLHGAVLTSAAVLMATASIGAARGDARATPSLHFFSGGGGAYADWLATTDQPPGDTDNQAIRLQTTTASNGYAGITVQHVEGTPAAAFPDSDFWLKAPNHAGPSLGSPRLVIQFQTAAGVADGDAELDPNVLTGSWQHVSDVSDSPNSGWDIHSAACPFQYHQQWSTAQSCHAGDVVSAAFLVADPYGVYHLIDDLTVDHVTFTQAANNSNS